MQPFKIKFDMWKSSSDYFLSVQKGELSFPVSVGVGLIRAAAWKSLGVGEEDIKQPLLRMGIERLLLMLESGDYPTESTITEQKITISVEDTVDFGNYLIKSCKFQTKTPTGSICEAASERDNLKRKTCQPLCDRCSIPSSDILCSHLCHPEGYSSGAGPAGQRGIQRAMCEKGHDPSNTRECKPDGKDCWELIYEPSEAIPEIPFDLADRVSDEIDFLNLAFEHAHHSKILELLHARSISDLFGECGDDEMCMFKVAVVADLINNLSVSETLSEEDQKGITGSINLLELYLSKFYPGLAGSLISKLRAVVKIRNSFPVHSQRRQLIETFQKLDIDYPITNWQKAWEKVLFAFWSSLRDLRRLIQS